MKERKHDPLTEHHIRPRSRNGGRENNIKKMSKSYHLAYHKLFINMTKDEIFEYLEKMWFSTEEFIPPQAW
jgi:hypothetical protein